MAEPAIADNDEDFSKELADAFASDEASEKLQPLTPVEPPKADDATPPVAGEELKPDDKVAPEVPKEGEPDPAAPVDEKKTEDGTTPPKDPKAPPVEEPATPQPLTKDDVTSIISNLRTEERNSGEALTNQVNEVMEAYYPDGLSNVLIDQNTGKELKTPQDVVDASNGDMSTEQAAQWLMNEQYKLDQNIAKIKDDAKTIAETTLKFKQDSTEVLTRYEPLFKAYPQVQQKVWDQYNKLVKSDMAKNVILSAPDMREYYDTMLEPYRLAFEFSQKQSATNPVPPPEAPVAPVIPGADDRLDEGGDGGASPVDDPNDFAQQVGKELAKGI